MRMHIRTQGQAHNRNAETDYCDWCTRTVQSPALAGHEEKFWDAIRETNHLYNSSGNQQEQFNRQDHLSSQFASKAQVGPPPALIKAKVPWSARRGNLSEKVGVLKTVNGILNKLTVEKFDVLTEQLLDSGITSAGILKDVVSLIFERAILQPTFCPMYAQLCYEVSCSLPSFPAEEPGDKMITFRRLLLNTCQEAFQTADNLRVEISTFTGPDQAMKIRDKERIFKLRTLGNIRLIGELLKRWMLAERIGHWVAKKLLGSDRKACPDEEHIKTICQFFSTIGKQLDDNPRSRKINDTYFIQIKELVANPQLTPRSKCMVLDLIDLRSNSWVPRCTEGARSEVSTGARGEIERPSFGVDLGDATRLTVRADKLESEVERTARGAELKQAWGERAKKNCEEQAKPSSEYLVTARMVMLLNELLGVGNEMLTLLKLAVAVMFALVVVCAVGVMKM